MGSDAGVGLGLSNTKLTISKARLYTFCRSVPTAPPPPPFLDFKAITQHANPCLCLGVGTCLIGYGDTVEEKKKEKEKRKKNHRT